MLITIIIFAAILSLLVFVHELGHFWTARKLGVGVDEFGFGLPPRIFGLRIFRGEQLKKMEETETIKVEVETGESIDGTPIISETITDEKKEIDVITPFKKFNFVWGNTPPQPSPYKGEGENYVGTTYSLNWIPVGGFVKIKGEEGDNREEKDSFAGRPAWQRIIILAAGVIMNLLLCVFLLSIGFGWGMPMAAENLGRGAQVRDVKIQVMEVLDNTSAKSADIKAGDVINTIDQKTFLNINEIRDYLAGKKDQEVLVAVKRGEDLIDKKVTVKENNGFVGIGVALAETATVRYPWYLAIWQGIKATFLWLGLIVMAFYGLIKNLIMGAPAGVAVAGPVGIAVMTGQAAKLGFIYVLQFAALLSLNLAIINILPFPALDGGRILFVAIEKIRGRAVKQQWENLAHNIGFMLLMILIVFVTYRDLLQYGGRILGTLKNLF